jgi:hypothetical protein
LGLARGSDLEVTDLATADDCQLLTSQIVMECNLPEREEILDLLLARGGADVLDVNGICRHFVGCFCFDVKSGCDFVML